MIVDPTGEDPNYDELARVLNEIDPYCAVCNRYAEVDRDYFSLTICGHQLSRLCQWMEQETGNRKYLSGVEKVYGFTVETHGPRPRAAFEADTLHRMAVETARFWAVEHYIRTGRLPGKSHTLYAYAGGEHGIGWGNEPGPDDPAVCRPLRYKRIRVTLSVEDDPDCATGEEP